MTTKPNLFNYATNELSQDAIICWLLEWANPRYSESDRSLHLCGVALIKAFLRLHCHTVNSIDNVVVKKQDKRIDVGALVNDRYYLLIEDKTDTKNHSNQLRKYYNYAKKAYPERVIVPIYLKTRDQSDIDTVRDEEHGNYIPFQRSDFLNELAHYEGSNAILLDFRAHLQSIENEVNAFKTTAISEWNRNQWIGFYQELKKSFPKGNWGYVSNPSGGFLGFWFPLEIEQYPCPIKLQIEQSKLCFKIRVEEKTQRTKFRNKWLKQLRIRFNAKDSVVDKPHRFGSGLHMTVAEYKNEFRITDNEGIINLSATIQNLKLINRSLASEN